MKRFLACLLLLLMLLRSGPAHAWTLVQASGSDQKSGTTASQAFNATVASGSIVAGAIFYTSTSTSNLITSITDDKSNTYTIIGFTTANPTQQYNMATFWSGGALTNGPKTLTFNLSASAGAIWVQFGEFTPSAGTLSADGSNGAYAASGSPTVSLTTTANGDLVIAAAAINGTVSGVGSGWTVMNTNEATSGPSTAFPAESVSEYQTQASAGAITGNWTGTPAADSISSIFALKAVTSGASCPPPALALLGAGC